MRRFPFMAVIGAAILLAAIVLVLERVPSPQGERADRDLSAGRGADGGKAERAPAPGLPEKRGEGRKIAIIIDDIGYDRQALRALVELPVPIAFAVLPFTPHGAEAARELHAAGRELLLHLPMEPHSYPADNPGKGALLTGMTPGEIGRQIAAALAEVPHAAGINNHMGSRFMEDEAAMAVVMEELARRNLFFVDSLTTPASRGRERAAQAGVRFAVRSAFIDHPPHDGAVFERLTRLPRRGRGGTAPLLLIGHPRAETVRALQAAQPLWRSQGTEVISVAAYLAQTAGATAAGKEGMP